MRQAVRKVGAETEFTATQAAEGLEEYAKAGIKAEAAMGLLAGTAVLATNAEVEFAQAASISLDALDAFNMRSKDSAETAANLARVNDALTTVVTSAKLDFEDFAETLKYAGPVAASTGAEVEDLATLTGLVAKAGIRGTLAGTTLKNTYLGLAAPVGKGAKMLKKLGVQISNNDGTMRDALDILIDFQSATEGMGEAQRLAATNAVFGRRAIAGVSKILSLGKDDLIDYRIQMLENAGAAERMAKEMRGSIQNRLMKIKSAATEMGIKFFDAFGPHIQEAIKGITRWLDDANTNSSEWVGNIVDAAKAIADFTKFLVENADTIKTLIKSYLIFKGTMFTGGMLQGATDGIMNLSGGFSMLTTNITGPGGAMAGVKGFKGVLRGIPGLIGPITVALGAGLALGTALWDTLVNAEEEARKLANQQDKLNRGAEADLKYFSDDDLKKAEALQKDLLKDKRTWYQKGFDWVTGIGEEEREDLMTSGSAYLDKIQAEKARRKREKLREFSSGGDIPAPWRSGSTSTSTSHYERSEHVQSIDWGTPPPGVTVGPPQPNLAGSMP
jgi:TP901 family phage tail tape measure protein